MRDPKLIVLLFNECINNRDLEGLVQLMSEDHALYVFGRQETEGITPSREAWRGFFATYPDYLNHFVRVDSDGENVAIVGHSTCPSEPELHGPALWSAVVQDDLLTEWQVCQDTPEQRVLMNLL